MRSIPEAFLGRQVLVCEGKTEIGVIRGHDSAWGARHDSKSLAHVGVVTAFGSGNETGKRARAFAELGYSVAVLADSDVSFEPGHAALVAIGIPVVRWAGDCAIEERVAIDLSWDSVCGLFDLLVEESYTAAQLIDVMSATTGGAAAMTRLGVSRADLGNSLAELLASGCAGSRWRTPEGGYEPTLPVRRRGV